MKTIWICVATAGAMLAVPVALAAPIEGPYASIAVGAANLMDADLQYPDNPARDRTGSFENGPAASLALGHGFESGLRAEIELAYRQNPSDFLTPGGPSDGEARSWAVMANGLYDLPVQSKIQPYVGFGLGAVSVEHAGLVADGAPLADDAGWAFAYQAILGARTEVSERWSLGLDYKFLGAADPKIDDAQAFTYDTSYDSHSVMVSLTRSLR